MKQKNKFKIQYFSFNEYLSIFLALVILSALPSFLYSGSMDVIFNEYTKWYLLYWIIVTAILCSITAYQKFKTFSYPLKKLSQASKAVAQGDFSVYIEPLHTLDKRNYMDFMFDDFNHMVRELGSIETLKNDFISDVSHELKTPLTIIQNYTTLLKDQNVSPYQRNEYLEAIIEATHKLSNLITNILKLNKLENQEILVVSKPYDLCRQLCESVILYETIVEKKKIQLEVEIEDKAFIPYEEEMLAIVWNNLLSNAVKFTNEFGRIQIKQTSDNNCILVEISDSGCGMNEETLKHIFDKFYQGDISHNNEGNGLGLALVSRIIEKINGSITVTSKVGEGTTFYIRLNI